MAPSSSSALRIKHTFSACDLLLREAKHGPRSVLVVKIPRTNSHLPGLVSPQQQPMHYSLGGLPTIPATPQPAPQFMATEQYVQQVRHRNPIGRK